MVGAEPKKKKKKTGTRSLKGLGLKLEFVYHESYENHCRSRHDVIRFEF